MKLERGPVPEVEMKKTMLDIEPTNSSNRARLNTGIRKHWQDVALARGRSPSFRVFTGNILPTAPPSSPPPDACCAQLMLYTRVVHRNSRVRAGTKLKKGAHNMHRGGSWQRCARCNATTSCARVQFSSDCLVRFGCNVQLLTLTALCIVC